MRELVQMISLMVHILEVSLKQLAFTLSIISSSSVIVKSANTRTRVKKDDDVNVR